VQYDPTREWMTTNEVAYLLDLKPSTIRARRNEGRERLPFVKIGQTVLYDAAAVRAEVAKADR
jgi:hypothetical protein